nr:alkaline phosphatase family protein [Bacteriovoracaceae bacterium]
EILQSMTGPGHATILTGSYPYVNGIPANDWYDQNLKSRVYCTEDQSVKTIGANPKDVHVGTSPRNLVGTTFGDELKNAGWNSKVVSLAIKDRAAILMGGHRADLAIWLDKETSRWVSSDYYLNSKVGLPAWIKRFNDEMDKKKEDKLIWTPASQLSGLSIPNGQLDEKNSFVSKIGASFPHEAKAGSPASLLLPYGSELTESLAEMAAKEFNLGNGSGKQADVLAVSFSTHDYLGHGFGPNSVEMEEMTIADDAVISKYLNFLNTHVKGGLKNVLIVLTADHGIPPNPDLLKENKMNAGRISEKKLEEEIETSLNKKFGTPKKGSYLAYQIDLNFYFDRKILSEQGASLADAEAEAKSIIQKTKGIAFVFTSSDYAKRILPPGIHTKQILNTYIADRSGDVIAIPLPFYFVDGNTVTHMTGYSYDRSVPLILAGKRIKPGLYGTPSKVVDIAPTLSFLFGTLPPALSEGRILNEIIK